jgi:hypothetical protein
MQRTSKWIPLLIGVFASAALAQPAPPEDLQTTVEALKARLRDATNRLAEVESQLARQQASLADVAKEMGADARKRSAGPNWLENLKFYGDLRLRWQAECFSGQDVNTKDRNRLRYRLRLGVIKTWLDNQMEVGFRLASGSSDDPTSTNQTMDDHFARDEIWIDQAYAKYTPKCIPGLTVMGGKFANPLVHTDIVWDSDVNPEGGWLQYKPKVGNLEPFVGAGYFSLAENYPSPHGATGFDHTLRDVTLHVYQVGADWKIDKDVKYTVAAAYYDFDHFDVSYRAANGNQTLPLTADGKAYNRLAYEYRMFDLVNKVGWKMLRLPWSAYFDWVHNCGDPYNSDALGDQRDAYAIGLKVGQNKKKGDWSFGYKYAYIEANATPGALNDSDFGHSNRKGHVWSAAYNLDHFLTVGGSIFWTEPVTGSHEDERTVTTQLDLVWKF